MPTYRRDEHEPRALATVLRRPARGRSLKPAMIARRWSLDIPAQPAISAMVR